MKHSIIGGCVVVAAVAAGCGEGGGEAKAPFPDVIGGRVTLRGEPLRRGFVRIVGGGREAVMPIAPDGRYEIPGPPTGDTKVAVTAVPPGPKPRPGEPRDPSLPDVPAKYADPATSGLSLTVTGGRQTFDIALD